MITAPSTIKPKSMAPSDIRLPLTPNAFMRMIAKSMHSGITLATMRPARQLPRKSTSTKITIKAPSIKLVFTVLIARFTRVLRTR